MDPLSVSASIVGLIVAAVQVSAMIKKFIDTTKEAPNSAQGVLLEVTALSVCLSQLQRYVSGKQEVARSRKSLVMVEQVIVVLTDCVSMFSELEQTLDMLKTDHPMRVIDRLKWAMKETAMNRILRRLQTSKASLNFMLTTLT